MHKPLNVKLSYLLNWTRRAKPSRAECWCWYKYTRNSWFFLLHYNMEKHSSKQKKEASEMVAKQWLTSIGNHLARRKRVATKCASDVRFGRAKTVQNRPVYRLSDERNQQKWRLTIEAKYESMYGIAAKIVIAQLSSWHILIGLSQFADSLSF